MGFNVFPKKRDDIAIWYGHSPGFVELTILDHTNFSEDKAGSLMVGLSVFAIVMSMF